MFMCKECLEQFEDTDLAYTLIPEKRLNHPGADMFYYKFCSLGHTQTFLQQISHQWENYILTRYKGGEKKFEPAPPKELLLLIGSSKG